MFLLQKLVSRLLFPVPLALIVAAAGLLLAIRSRRRRRLGYGLIAGALVFVWLASTAPIADALLWSLEGRYPPIGEISEEIEGDVDAIVVLGGGHAERDGFGPWASLGESSRARVIEGVRLARRSDLPLVFTAYAGAGEISSAEMGRRAAVELGIAEERTAVYPEPRNTAEEAATVAGAYPDAAVLLVTSASHMPRAKYLFERAGVSAVAAPTDFRAANRDYSPWSLLPGAGAFGNTERAWYEYMGLVWERVRGR